MESIQLTSEGRVLYIEKYAVIRIRELQPALATEGRKTRVYFEENGKIEFIDVDQSAVEVNAMVLEPPVGAKEIESAMHGLLIMFIILAVVLCGIFFFFMSMGMLWWQAMTVLALLLILLYFVFNKITKFK